MTFRYALRYFRIVPVVPSSCIAAFAIAVAAAALRLTTSPSAAIDALTPLLLLQLFVASSGFQLAARRGHYDLLLTSATPRWQIALAHCLVSIAPGIVSWLCVGIIELVASRGNQCVSAAAGTCAAFVGASLVAWSVAVFSTRMTVAIGWVLVITIPSIARVASPVQLLGMTTRTPGVMVLSIASAASLVCFAAAVISIVRGAAPLEAAQ
jgi:hypothetical protein